MSYKWTILTLAIAVSIASLSVFSWAAVSGFEYGFFYGVFQNPPNDGLAAHGPNYYQEHNLWYFRIVLLLLIFMVAKAISSRIGAVVALILVVNLVTYWSMVTFKNEVLGLEVCCESYPWLRTSVVSDYIAAVATLTVILLEGITYLRTYANSPKSLRSAV